MHVTVGGIGLVWKLLSKLWTWHTEPKKRLQEVEHELEIVRLRQHGLEEVLKRDLAFERRLSGMVSRPEDDNLYRHKDGTGAYFCPVCIQNDRKFIAVRNHFKDSYRCPLHDIVFELEVRRVRIEQDDRRRAAASRRNRPRGPHAWMAN